MSLMNVSRVSFGEVQRSLAGIKSYAQVACAADIPSRRSRRCSPLDPCQSRHQAGSAKREGHSFMLARSKLGCVMR